MAYGKLRKKYAYHEYGKKTARLRAIGVLTQRILLQMVLIKENSKKQAKQENLETGKLKEITGVSRKLLFIKEFCTAAHALLDVETLAKIRERAEAKIREIENP